MLVTAMLTQIDAHGFDSQSEAVKLQAINDAQDDFCNRHPWPFLEDAVTVNTTAADWSPTLPTDFRAVISIYNTVTKLQLKYIRYEALHSLEGVTLSSVGQDSPYLFYFAGPELRLYPTPAAAESLRFYYIKTPAVIDDSADTLTVPDRYHRIILLGALSYLYMINDDDTLSERFARRFEDRIIQALNDGFMRQYSNPDVVHVISSVDDYQVD